MKLAERQSRLRKIAEGIDCNELGDDDREFIVDALLRVADGEDASIALDVKAKRGDRRTLTAQKKIKDASIRDGFVCSWIAAATAAATASDPYDAGLGLALDEAAGLIGENGLNAFGLTEETIKSKWNKNPSLRSRDFKMSKD